MSMPQKPVVSLMPDGGKYWTHDFEHFSVMVYVPVGDPFRSCRTAENTGRTILNISVSWFMFPREIPRRKSSITALRRLTCWFSANRSAPSPMRWSTRNAGAWRTWHAFIPRRWSLWFRGVKADGKTRRKTSSRRSQLKAKSASIMRTDILFSINSGPRNSPAAASGALCSVRCCTEAEMRRITSRAIA